MAVPGPLMLTDCQIDIESIVVITMRLRVVHPLLTEAVLSLAAQHNHHACAIMRPTRSMRRAQCVPSKSGTTRILSRVGSPRDGSRHDAALPCGSKLLAGFER